MVTCNHRITGRSAGRLFSKSTILFIKFSSAWLNFFLRSQFPQKYYYNGSTMAASKVIINFKHTLSFFKKKHFKKILEKSGKSQEILSVLGTMSLVPFYLPLFPSLFSIPSFIFYSLFSLLLSCPSYSSLNIHFLPRSNSNFKFISICIPKLATL